MEKTSENSKVKKGGRPTKDRSGNGVVRSPERVQILLDPAHPVEGALLEAYKSGDYFPDGKDYIRGLDIVRRVLVLGWDALTEQNPGAYRGQENTRMKHPSADVHALKGASVHTHLAPASAHSAPKKPAAPSLDDDAFGSAPV